jgi:hypothetical protein
VPEEIIWFLLAKEFGWSPRECKRQDAKDMKAITHILSTYNKVRNSETEKASKAKSASKGGGGFGRGNKYIRRETVGPEGINVLDTPI